MSLHFVLVLSSICLAGLVMATSRFLYKLWKLGLLPHFVHQMQLRMVFRSTVFAVAEMPPGGAAVFYFFPEVENFTLEVARLYQAVGWVVGLGRIPSDAFGNQVVMCLRAPQDPAALRDSLIYLKRVSAMRIRAS